MVTRDKRRPALTSLKPRRQTHGSFFWKASTEGLISNTSSIHAGIRTRLSEFEDLTHDADVGFKLLTTDDIDELKPSGIVKVIKQRVGNMPVCASRIPPTRAHQPKFIECG